MKRWMNYAAACTFWIFPLVYADDLTGAVALPGLESDPPNTASPGDCGVSVVAGRVSIDLSLTVAGESALLLQTPLFGHRGPPDPYPERQFPELTIGINGQSRALNDRFEAFVGTRDVTMLVQTAGMDPWTITHTPPLTTSAGAGEPILKFLIRVGAIEPSGGDYLAKWQARRVIRVPLESAQVQHVQLDYALRPANTVIPVEQLDTTTREKAYCLSPSSLRRITHKGSDHPRLGISEFSIATGIDGKPPGSVTISMSPATGIDSKHHSYLFLCGPHGKPIATERALTRERAEVDDLGNLHVLAVIEAAPP